MSAVSSIDPARKPGFKARFHAWWEGEDIAPEPKAAPAPAPKSVATAKAAPASVDPFDRAELQIPQQVWGAGFTGPGGESVILNLVKPFGINSEMTLMDFGARLGGGTRAVSEKFAIWIAGFEPDADLAKMGQEISLRKGIKRAEIKPYNEPEFTPKPAAYDGIFSCETLYGLAEKEKLLGTFERTLKPRGHIAITDFVRAPGVPADDPRLAGFTGRSGKPGHFWSDEEYQNRMNGLKFDIRVTEDITANYRSMVIEGWVNFTESGEGKNSARNFPEEMVAEVDFWTRRTAAIDSGAVQLRRYYGIKMNPGKVE